MGDIAYICEDLDEVECLISLTVLKVFPNSLSNLQQYDDDALIHDTRQNHCHTMLETCA